MENNLHNGYLFKALDAYPYNLEETLEALNYALSYNGSDAHALYLMGLVYAEQLQEYDIAKEYFAEAMASKMDLPVIYPFYIRTLIKNEDYQEAQKLLDFAYKVKGTDKAFLKSIQAVLYEKTGNYKRAVSSYKKAIRLAVNNAFVDYAEKELDRVKKKLKSPKKGKRKRIKRSRIKKKGV